MKNTFRLFAISCSLLGLSSMAATVISQVHVDYAQSLMPADRQGYLIPEAIVGGKVDFTGAPPVYVTLRTGGQNYTQLADQQGNFSFLVYANSGQFTIEAWSGAAAPVVSIHSMFQGSK